MMLKKYFLPLVAALLCLSCSDKTYDDLAGADEIKGVAVIYDDLSGTTTSTPGKNLKIYLRNADDAAGFLYSTTANEQGRFVFGGIDRAKAYEVYASVDTGAVKYFGILRFAASNHAATGDSLKLSPSQTAQNGILLKVQDEQEIPIPGVTAWVFNNPFLFASDTSAGKIFDIPVNNYGIGYRLNLAPGMYYLRVKTRIGMLSLTGETSVSVPSNGIIDTTITLRNVPLARNGIEATITDTYGTLINGATVYAYRSQLLFERDTVSYTNSLFTMTSNAMGMASAYIIEPGTYYLRAIKVINTDTLKKTAVVLVGANSPSQVPMILQ
ncbi:hypothetical protein [Flaviaesturariibacter amylovorans]|uniref:DUF4382 domain-containing protein n=1 Tax=Flaviaesturariibacter amylovorans TaxID=1084520 RepID=A0ABP8G6S0_9BACT